MTSLPFKTYSESKEYFGISLQETFINNLFIIDEFCQKHSIDLYDILLDLFGIVRIEGKEARYQQTPIELFPFGSTGSDGTHYGFVIHTLEEVENPAGEICPMDSDGVIMIGHNTHWLFQNLMTDTNEIEKYLELVIDLGLEPKIDRTNRYGLDGKGVKVRVNPKDGWKFVETSDGVGVYAEEYYFDNFHDSYRIENFNRTRTIEKFEELANSMHKKGLFASQLYYLKELYWYEWTNYELAKKYLELMLLPYEELNRQHLYDTAKDRFENFDQLFPRWM